MVENNQVDLIFTVSKVGEGWNVPTLRASLWFCATTSPAKKIQGVGRTMRCLNAGSEHPKKTSANTYILEPTFRVRSDIFKEINNGNEKTHAGESDQKNLKKRGDDILKHESKSFFQFLVDRDEFSIDGLQKNDSELKLMRPFDPNNPDHVREIIGKPQNLIKNERGETPINLFFRLKEKGWAISCRALLYYFKEKSNISTVEDLLKRLWPDEAKQLLFDPKNDDHLRELFGKPQHLIKNGKGFLRKEKEFKCEEKGRDWVMSGIKIKGILGLPNLGFATVEALVKSLWPDEAKQLLFDPKNDDHLRDLIGKPENLVKDKLFKCEEKGRDWVISFYQIASTVGGGMLIDLP